jgi:phage shock protein A
VMPESPLVAPAAGLSAPNAAPLAAAPASVLGSVAGAAEALSAPNAGPAAAPSVLNGLYEGTLRASDDSDAVSALSAANDGARLSPSATPAAKAAPAVSARRNGGDVITVVGIGAGVIAVLALVSKPFRAILQRLWNVTLGRLSLFAKKQETPEVIAQRIIDQLNAAKPVYNKKVEEASTLVEKLRLQIKGEQEKVAELETNITALLSDSDPNNDVMASGMINQQKILNGSIAASQQQLTLSEKVLQDIKDERARFFAEREETIAKINAKLTQAKQAEITQKMAELRGGFSVGDLKDNLDRLDQAVNDKVAGAAGAKDSLDSNPDEILRRAKDSVRNSEVNAEIERRKKEIAEKKAKGNGGALNALGVVGIVLFILGIAQSNMGLVIAGIIFWLILGQDSNRRNGGDVLTIAAVAAGAIALLALLSRPFRDILARLWNVTLGRLSLFAKKTETPEVIAQRIIDQLNAAKPEYNRKVQEASTLVEQLRLQIQSQKEKSAELDANVTAILSDSDPNNDLMAATLINQKKVIDASTTASEDQLKLSEATLQNIKDERARFFAEREETIARINAKLTVSKQAEITQKMAELRGGFDIGSLKDNLDRLDQAVNDKVAGAAGAKDSLDSNPDEILRRAKDSVRNSEVNEEIERRKREIAEKKAKGNGTKLGVPVLRAIDAAWTVFAAVYASMNTGWLAALLGMGALLPGLGILGAIGGGVFAEKILKTSGAKTAGAFILGGLAGWVGGLVGGFYVGFALSGPVVAGVFTTLAVVTMLLEWLFDGKKKAADAAKNNGGDVLTIASIAAAVIAVLAYVSRPFRDILVRLWNVTLGRLSLFTKKQETPEVIAQRIIDQLNAAKPLYNRKVEEASTLVEKLRLQIKGEQEKVAELESNITALLSDSDPNNDTMASGMINQQKILSGSITASQEQLKLSEVTLQNIKDERARFFAEREETIAKINAKLTQAKQAEITQKMAELRGGFSVGDLKDNLDRLDQAVNDKVAGAAGAKDSLDSNPDEILRRAKDSVRNAEVNEEIERRKREIAEKKAKGNGGLTQGQALSLFGKAIAVGLALAMPIASSLVIALAGVTTLLMSSENSRKVGKQLGIIGLATLVIGGAIMALGVNVGFLGLATFGGSFGFIIPGALSLMAGVLAHLKARSSDKKLADAVPQAAAPVAAPAPAPKAEQGPSKLGQAGKAVADAGRATWNATLETLGKGVGKLETPEVLAQRVVDQLDAAKRDYAKQLRDAATLVARLKIQVESQKADSAKLDEAANILLSDNDPTNDLRAAGILNQKKALDASTAATQEQVALAEKQVQDLVIGRQSFLAERAVILAKIASNMPAAKAAELNARISAIDAQFAALEQSIAVGAMPQTAGQILADAKASGRAAEVAAELEARKRAISEGKGGSNGAKIPGQVWVGALAGLGAMVAFISGIGFAAALPYFSVMGWAGMAAGLAAYFSSNGRGGAIAGAVAGGIMASLTVIASPAIIALGVAAGAFVGWFGATGISSKKGIGDFIGAVMGSMVIGMTLPVWLGALAGKKLFDRAAAKNNGGLLGFGLLPLAGATGAAALLALVGGGVAGFAIGVVGGYIYLDFLSKKRHQRDLNDLVLGVLGYGALAAIVGAIASVLYFI